MIEKDDVILVDGVGYTVAELEANPRLAGLAEGWWRGRNQERIATIKLYEAEARSHKSKGGKAAAARGTRKLRTKAQKDSKWLAAVKDILATNPTLTNRAVAMKVVNRGLAAESEQRTIAAYVEECRPQLGLDKLA